jgi:hypothetical protein
MPLSAYPEVSTGSPAFAAKLAKNVKSASLPALKNVAADCLTAFWCYPYLIYMQSFRLSPHVVLPSKKHAFAALNDNIRNFRQVSNDCATSVESS